MMASITFNGPSVLNPEQSSITEVSVPNDALLLVTEAICVRFGYDPQLHGTPGVFAIQKTIDWWKDIAVEYQQDQAATTARAAAKTSLDPLISQISVELQE
jgi:hypothetical protein